MLSEPIRVSVGTRQRGLSSPFLFNIFYQGLIDESLINAANKYISLHGLRFNPSKTTCTTFGTNHLTPLPTWHICHNLLTETNQVTYLGTVLSNDVSPHIDVRIKAVRGAFYGLQLTKCWLVQEWSKC